jgi:hypothetical protein
MSAANRRFQPRRRKQPKPPKLEEKDAALIEFQQKAGYAEKYLPSTVEHTPFANDANKKINKIDGPKLQMANTDDKDEINIRVVRLIKDVNKDKDLDINEVILELDGLVDITKDDLGYIITKAKNKSVISWAKTELAAKTKKRRKRK